ncbi:MAG: hypothetical protein H8E03_01185 [Pelagibacteraceae bacterium]|nr:hypothetical protein [Pelagibacteraceae bacterium]
MKLEALKKYITKVVHEEVEKQVKKIFITEGTHSTSKSMISSKKPTVRESIAYSKDKSINAILNETTGFTAKPKAGFEDYPSLGNGTFDTTKMTEMLGYGDMSGRVGDKKQQREFGAVQTIKSVPGVQVDDVPESTQNALTRDYSELMKALNKKDKK